MKETVPGLLSLVATNLFEGYQDVSLGYTHTLVSTHVDAQAVHPDHKRLAEYCYPRLAKEGGAAVTDFYSAV
ncbi:Hypothetical protein, putative [Bodo saltans]|uniref:Uncharacterized protein n=1 Tax=Bodo saltans TaxID=75058 RepID=A0A0S4J339_BODSA|nr:Hypothetical protein, putative [Bodo saltans]|eukprot:CUG67858.1 Hypothetical protein, putative [Bodo saltans]